AKRAAAVARQRRRAAVAPVAAAEPARPTYAPVAPPVNAPVVEEWPTEPMQPVADAPAATGTDDRWEPVPVPRPTYTMKPKAPQRWTYARPAQQQPAQPEPQPQVAEETAAPVEPAATAETTPEVSELDGILEHRWAVND